MCESGQLAALPAEGVHTRKGPVTRPNSPRCCSCRCARCTARLVSPGLPLHARRSKLISPRCPRARPSPRLAAEVLEGARRITRLERPDALEPPSPCAPVQASSRRLRNGPRHACARHTCRAPAWVRQAPRPRTGHGAHGYDRRTVTCSGAGHASARDGHRLGLGGGGAGWRAQELLERRAAHAAGDYSRACELGVRICMHAYMCSRGRYVRFSVF